MDAPHTADGALDGPRIEESYAPGELPQAPAIQEEARPHRSDFRYFFRSSVGIIGYLKIQAGRKDPEFRVAHQLDWRLPPYWFRAGVRARADFMSRADFFAPDIVCSAGGSHATFQFELWDVQAPGHWPGPIVTETAHQAAAYFLHDEDSMLSRNFGYLHCDQPNDTFTKNQMVEWYAKQPVVAVELNRLALALKRELLSLCRLRGEPPSTFFDDDLRPDLFFNERAFPPSSVTEQRGRISGSTAKTKTAEPRPATSDAEPKALEELLLSSLRDAQAVVDRQAFEDRLIAAITDASAHAGRPEKVAARKAKGKAGRKRLTEEAKRARRLLNEKWRTAREAGVSEKDFCHDEHITMRELKASQEFERAELVEKQGARKGVKGF
jgi:hypothetical protein